jgi:hypothetical protein
MREFLTKYDGSPLPTDNIARNVLEEMGVAADATERVLQLILDNVKELGLLRELKGRFYVRLGAPASPDPTIGLVDTLSFDGEEADEEREDDIVDEVRRQDLVAARTQTINRLHRLLVDLVPGGARRNLTANRAATLLAAVTPAGAAAVTRWQLATELVVDVRELEQRIATVEARIKTAVTQSSTSLLQLFGVGPVLAATFLGEVGDIGRFPSKHHFAAHTGTAPLEASSGQVVGHRLSRAGDRKLNYALYMMAMVQVRRPSAGQAYYRRKLAEGKSPKEALRCL